MSREAIDWAMVQDCGGSSTSFVLVCLAHHAKPDTGICWPSQAKIAELTRQSKSTVRRRVRELEAMGLIFQVHKRKGHGHFAVSEFVLLLNKAARSYARSNGWEPGKAAPRSAAQSLAKDFTGVQSCEHPSVVQSCEHPSSVHCGTTEQETIELEPPLPPETFDDSAAVPKAVNATPLASTDWRLAWAAFDAMWPWPESAPREPSRRAFQRLTPDERALAERHAVDFIAAKRREGRMRFDARRYLRSLGWEPWSAERTQAPRESQVLIVKGTREWEAWEAEHRRRTGKRSMFSTEFRRNGSAVEGILRPARYPPGFQDGTSQSNDLGSGA